MAIDKQLLPKPKYTDFDNSRLIDMGIHPSQADDLVRQLIADIDEYIPKIESALESQNYDEIETLNHRIRGSAATVGSGGIVDVFHDFNIYLKYDYDIEIISEYVRNIKKYQIKLKIRYHP